METEISTEHDDRKSAFRFLLRIAVFLLPVIAILGTAELALWRTGDAWPAQWAIDHQLSETSESVYGRAFLSQQFGVYKMVGLRTIKPEILAVGSSRVMQFRNEVFSSMRFYNAGGLMQNVYDLQLFARMVAEGEIPAPRIAIVGIDPWWLKTGYGDDDSWLRDGDVALSFAAHVEAFRRILIDGEVVDLLEGIWLERVTPIFRYDAIGGQAIRSGSGFRKDGSRQYPTSHLVDFAKDPRFIDREVPSVINRIQKHTRQFSLPATIETDRVDIVLESLTLLRESGIEVWAFFPPFSDQSMETIESDPIYRELWTVYRDKLPSMIQEAGISVVPVSSPSDHGLTDIYMIDGMHPSEVFVALLALEMIDSASESSSFRRSDRNRIVDLLDSAESPMVFVMPVSPSEPDTTRTN